MKYLLRCWIFKVELYLNSFTSFMLKLEKIRKWNVQNGDRLTFSKLSYAFLVFWFLSTPFGFFFNVKYFYNNHKSYGKESSLKCIKTILISFFILQTCFRLWNWTMSKVWGFLVQIEQWFNDFDFAFFSWLHTHELMSPAPALLKMKAG